MPLQRLIVNAESWGPRFLDRIAMKAAKKFIALKRGNPVWHEDAPVPPYPDKPPVESPV